MKENYIPAPWFVCDVPKNDAWFPNKTIGAANPNDARRVCDVWSLCDVKQGSVAHANARRIVACVNACEGLDTELLEASVGTMFHTLRMIERLGAERDKYRKALEDCYQYHQFESAFITRNQVRNILIEALK